MLDYLKAKLERRRLKQTFAEYGYAVKRFEIDGFGTVEYAQWQHPFEKPKVLTRAHVAFYERLTAPGDLIVDVGAHTGDTTVPMALAVGPAGKVIALEPNRYVFEVLAANARLNPASTDIEPLCFAATEADGTFTFNYSDASFCNGGFLSEIESDRHRHAYELDVEGRNLQDFLLEHHAADLARLTLVKVDAEGYDKEILKSLAGLLDRHHPTIITECYRRLTEAERLDLYAVLEGHGYAAYRLGDFEAGAPLERLAADDMTATKHFDVLAVHPSRRGAVTLELPG